MKSERRLLTMVSISGSLHHTVGRKKGIKHGQCGRSLELSVKTVKTVAALEEGDQSGRCYSSPRERITVVGLGRGNGDGDKWINMRYILENKKFSKAYHV